MEWRCRCMKPSTAGRYTAQTGSFACLFGCSLLAWPLRLGSQRVGSPCSVVSLVWLLLSWCFTSTETIRLIRDGRGRGGEGGEMGEGMRAQAHRPVHTAPELWRTNNNHCWWWCVAVMSSDVNWHIRDKLWPMPKHGSINLYVHGNQKAR